MTGDTQSRESRNAEGHTIAERFEAERTRMLPLPERAFRSAMVRTPEATRRSLVKLEGAVYSVPCEWSGLSLTAHVGVDQVEIVGPDRVTVTHPRVAFGGRSIDYRHYIPELARKPQAVRQVIDELLPALGAPFDDAWRHLVDEHGPRQAARIFARVLEAITVHGYLETATRVERSLRDGEPLQLALRASSSTGASTCDVPAHLHHVEVEAGRAADYDVLLGGAA